MNLIPVALAVLLTILTCLAQGQVNFANRVGANGSILNAPVVLQQPTPHGPGPDYSVQLLLVNANNSLTPLTPISTFNKAGTGAGAISSQFWVPKTVDIPGHFAGEALNFVVGLGSLHKAAMMPQRPRAADSVVPIFSPL
jgi:hypothetical protein